MYEKYIKDLEERKDINALQDELYIIVIIYYLRYYLFNERI